MVTMTTDRSRELTDKMESLLTSNYSINTRVNANSNKISSKRYSTKPIDNDELY